ncbi:MAG: YeeE/YedE family protein [Gammaproteobacteria bacterium]|nr:YeeE/YedE family protein [Gammaproteobacteria bacterium]
MQWLAALLVGVLFGAGLLLAGMTNPAKVINFLDITGAWDPSLVFVMGGGATVAAAAFWRAKGLSRPLLADVFALPTRKQIDLPLLLGSALFGIGWGLGGYCPGPALAGLVLGRSETLLFVVAMLGGMALHRLQSGRSKTGPKL